MAGEPVTSHPGLPLAEQKPIRVKFAPAVITGIQKLELLAAPFFTFVIKSIMGPLSASAITSLSLPPITLSPHEQKAIEARVTPIIERIWRGERESGTRDLQRVIADWVRTYYSRQGIVPPPSLSDPESIRVDLVNLPDLTPEDRST